MSYHPTLTWGQIKAWAQENGVPDGAEVRFAVPHRDLVRARDLSYYPAEDSDPDLFVLQEQWG